MSKTEYERSSKQDYEYFPYSEEIYGSETGSNTEYYSTDEYGWEPLQTKKQKEETAEQSRKRQKKLIPYFIVAAACAAVIGISKPGFISLSDNEHAYIQELQTAFEQKDYEEVLNLTIGGRMEGTVEMRRNTMKQTETYLSLLEKGAWSEELPVTVIIDDSIQMEENGTGLGMAFQEKKLYYGMLKDGFPEGEGICLNFSSGDYAYTKGNWKDGQINGYAENSFFLYDSHTGERTSQEQISGYYVNDLANGEMLNINSNFRNGKILQMIYEENQKKYRPIFEDGTLLTEEMTKRNQK